MRGKASIFVNRTPCKIFFAHTDSIVCVEYLLQGHSAWGCFAMGFTVLPACVTQLFSLRWHRSDGSLRTVHWLLHFLLLGFLHRYFTFIFAQSLPLDCQRLIKLIYTHIIYSLLITNCLPLYLFSGTWLCFTLRCTLWEISRTLARTRIGCIGKKAIYVCCICLSRLWGLLRS